MCSISFVDHIDVEALNARGLILGYTPDVLTDAGKLSIIHERVRHSYEYSFVVADVSVMLALMAGRNVRETMPMVIDGDVRSRSIAAVRILTSAIKHSGPNTLGLLTAFAVLN